MSRPDFGQYVLIASLILVLACIGRLGLERVIVRFATKALADNNVNLYWQSICRGYSIAFVATILTILAWSFAMLFADQWLLGWHVSRETVLLSGLGVGLGSFLMLSAESFRAIGHQGLAVVCAAEVSSPLISGVQIAILLGSMGSGPIGLEFAFVTLVIAMAVPGMVALIFLPRLLVSNAPSGGAGGHPSKDEKLATVSDSHESHELLDTSNMVSFRTLMDAGLQTMLVQLVTYVTVLADIYFAGRFCSPEDFGLYAAAKRLANIASIPMSVVVTSASATISIMYARGETAELQKILQRLATVGLVPTFLLFSVFVLFPQLALAGLYGNQYSAGANILMILSIGYAVLACSGAAEMTLVMTGNQVWALWISILGLVSLSLCAMVFSRWDGSGIAVAIAFSLMFSMRSVLMWLTAKLRAGIWTNPNAGSFITSRFFRLAIAAAAIQLADVQIVEICS